jgi:hypothetical protein
MPESEISKSVKWGIGEIQIREIPEIGEIGKSRIGEIGKIGKSGNPRIAEIPPPGEIRQVGHF